MFHEELVTSRRPVLLLEWERTKHSDLQSPVSCLGQEQFCVVFGQGFRSTYC
jgi:hypothetical protein